MFGITNYRYYAQYGLFTNYCVRGHFSGSLTYAGDGEICCIGQISYSVRRMFETRTHYATRI